MWQMVLQSLQQDSGTKLFNFIRGSILGGVKVVAKTIGRVL